MPPGETQKDGQLTAVAARADDAKCCSLPCGFHVSVLTAAEARVLSLQNAISSTGALPPVILFIGLPRLLLSLAGSSRITHRRRSVVEPPSGTGAASDGLYLGA